MKDVPVADAVKILRQNLGDAMPLSYWRLVRLVAISRAFGNSSDDVLDKLGKEIGKLLAVAFDDVHLQVQDFNVLVDDLLPLFPDKERSNPVPDSVIEREVGVDQRVIVRRRDRLRSDDEMALGPEDVFHAGHVGHVEAIRVDDFAPRGIQEP